GGGVGGEGGEGLGAGGWVEAMRRLQVGLSQGLSDWLRHVGQARSAAQRLGALGSIKPRDIHLHVLEVRNRTTGKSMGEHCEEMAQTWRIGREPQDRIALASH